MAKYKLGDICEIVSGSTPKTSIDEYWDGDVKWITPAELNDDSYIISDSARKITELAVKKTGLISFPEGTVILSSRAPIGKVAIAGCEMYCNQGFKNLICSDKINNKYLYWFLKGNTHFLNSLGRGATFKEISKAIVSEIEINIPDIEKQKKVVEILEKVRGVIVLRKKELSILDNLIKARFVEMFGDENNSKNWDVVNVEEVADIRQHQDNIAIAKLRTNQPLTSTDISTLEEILWKEVGTKDEYVAEYGNKPLGELVREIVGLDMNAAKEAFSEYLTDAHLDSRQIYFVNQIVEYIIHNGIMKDLSVLQEAPFTNQGSVVDIFTDLNVWMGIRKVIDSINANAAA